MTIRVNNLVTNTDELLKDVFPDGSVSPLADDMIELPSLFGVDLNDRRYFVQDAASRLAVSALSPEPGDVVVDTCSAPGGKTTYAAELGGIVTARDISEEKTDRIRENAERLKLSVTVEERDASVPCEADREGYDVVIADVPCSGLGVMGRKNDIKYHYSREGVKALVEQASKILDAAAAAVRPGGMLLFSTCTILPQENRLQKEHFLKAHPEFAEEEERQLIQGEDPCDGFYYCRMRRNTVVSS